MATPVIRKTATCRAPKAERRWTASDGQVITEAAADALGIAFDSQDYGLADAEPVRVGRPALSRKPRPASTSRG